MVDLYEDLADGDGGVTRLEGAGEGKGVAIGLEDGAHVEVTAWGSGGDSGDLAVVFEGVSEGGLTDGLEGIDGTGCGFGRSVHADTVADERRGRQARTRSCSESAADTLAWGGCENGEKRGSFGVIGAYGLGENAGEKALYHSLPVA